MTPTDLVREIQAYAPYNDAEVRDRALILSCLAAREDVFRRTSEAFHMTVSAWVVNPARDKILMVYHNIYQSWSWLGGHADGECDLLSVARREVLEESGLADVRPLSEKIYSLEVLPVAGHEKRGVYVPSHLHLNLTYLFEAAEDAALAVKPDENSAVGWLPVAELERKVSERFMMERVYGKLIEKLPIFLGGGDRA